MDNLVFWFSIVCMATVGINVQGSTSKRALLKMTSNPPGVTTFGRNDQTPIDNYESSYSIYLTHRMPSSGILYQVEPFFVTTDPIYIQLWFSEEEYSHKFKLIFQMKASSDKVNTTKIIYLSDNGYCPLVNENVMLGIWSPSSRLPIAFYSDFSSSWPEFYWGMYQSSRPPTLSTELEFIQTTYPYSSGIKCFLFKENGGTKRRKRTPTAQCPTHLMPDYPISEPPSLEPVTSSSSTPEPSTQPEIQTTKLQQPTTSSDMEPDHYASGATVLSKKVIYIIVGVVAFLILLIVIIIVCCVVKRRNSSSNLSTNVTSDLSPAGNQQQQQQQGKHQQENLRKQPSNNYEEITHQQRINPGIESNQTQYEHPGPRRQDRPPQYTSLSMPQPGGVYEEIPDNNKAYNRDHGHAKNRPNTPKSDGYYLKPVDERGNQ
ncbi:hypothetical protein LSH36_241g03033 [Paralvinella palmiformis]|uniref:Uncharacterized protein n=1 Tax=Paralvinella palmiformis TaxID=53620 RepID=A0AAD9JMG5_9ANNE|nr:hypothetical protein LSH36_241g03033 [Paralvinella palmiformis]